MKTIVSLFSVFVIIAATAGLSPVLAAQSDSDDRTDDQALAEIYAKADEFAKAYYKTMEAKYGVTAAAYMITVKRHDIYAAFVDSLNDKILQQIAIEEWIHRESEAMIGSGRQFLSSIERGRRMKIDQKQRKDRLIKEREREIGVEMEDVE